MQIQLPVLQTGFRNWRGLLLAIAGLPVIIGIVWYRGLAQPTPLPGIYQPVHGKWLTPAYGFAIWFGLVFVAFHCRPLESEHAGVGSSTTRRVLPGLLLLLASTGLGITLAAPPVFFEPIGGIWDGTAWEAL